MRKILGLLLSIAAAIQPIAGGAKTPSKQASATPKATVWTQEPDGFLGIKFGQPFPDSATLPDCPKTSFGTTDYAPGYLCYEGYGRDSYGALWGLPKLGFGYTVHVMLDKGMVTSFVVGSSSDDFAALARILVQRYGKPTAQSSGSVKTKAGGEFDNQILQWTGAHVTIRSEMRSGEVDTSETYISDKAYWAARSQADDKAAAEGADKL